MHLFTTEAIVSLCPSIKGRELFLPLDIPVVKVLFSGVSLLEGRRDTPLFFSAHVYDAESSLPVCLDAELNAHVVLRE